MWLYTKSLFGNITAEQILFQVQYGKDTIGHDIKPIEELFFKSFLVTSLSLIVIFALDWFLYRAFRQAQFFMGFRKKVFSYMPLLIIFISIFTIYTEAKVGDLIASRGNDFIKKNYILPNTIELHSQKKKNLVLIYVESLEQTYRNSKIFSENLIKSLDELPGYEYKNYIQTPNTGWTMAATVGTQCGIPLKPIISGEQAGNRIGEQAKKFLASATCLGDTLAKEGYHNEIMQGARLAFSGRDKFFKNHGYQDARGRDEWLIAKYTNQDMHDRGLYDDLLMQEARLTIDKLVASKKLFNLTLFTIDTHFPMGHLSKTCKNSGGKTIQDVIKCSSQEVAQFVRYIIGKGYLEHTNIVILGDHLTMPNSIYDLVIKEPNRSIYNKWISKEPFEASRTDITHFDVAPTILDFLGMKVSGGRYGLGYSAYGKDDNGYNPDIIEDYFLHLNSRSAFYESLWKIQ